VKTWKQADSSESLDFLEYHDVFYLHQNDGVLVYSSPFLLEGMFQDPQRVPDSEPYVYYSFFPIHIYLW
jgi:hypothetical protein